MTGADRQLLQEAIGELPENQRLAPEVIALSGIAQSRQDRPETPPEIAVDHRTPETSPDSAQSTPQQEGDDTETDGMRDSVGQYLHEIGQVPLLNGKAHERKLAQEIETGREARTRYDNGERAADIQQAIQKADQARDLFIRANLRLVVNIAKNYPLPPGMDLLDLVQEGNIGLEHAVEKFDWRKGFKFSTYATFWIRQAIGRSLDQKANLIRLKGNRPAQLRAELKVTAGEEEGLSEDAAMLYRLTTPASLDRPANDGDSDETGLRNLVPANMPGPEEQAMETFRQTALAEHAESVMSYLEPNERYAVELRFNINGDKQRSFREVGEALGIRPEGARRIIKRAIDKLESIKASSLSLLE